MPRAWVRNEGWKERRRTVLEPAAVVVAIGLGQRVRWRDVEHADLGPSAGDGRERRARLDHIGGNNCSCRCIPALARQVPELAHRVVNRLVEDADDAALGAHRHEVCGRKR